MGPVEAWVRGGLAGGRSQAAGDAQYGAGGVRRLGAEQPGDGGGDLVGFAGAAQRDPAGGAVGPVGDAGVGVDAGVDDAGRDGVDPDAVGGEFLGQADGEGVGGGFGGGVVDVFAGAAEGGGGRRRC